MRKLGQNRPNLARVHAYIATPAYDGRVLTEYAQSLAETAFCAPLYNVGITAGVLGNGAFIDLARNIFVRKFLDDEEYAECTHLFFIDADLKFEARAFIGLIKSGLPICAGVYRRRQEPEEYPARLVANPEGGGIWVDMNGWLMCDRVPTGFLCISREVLTEMAEDVQKLKIHGQPTPVPRLFYTRLDEENRFIGEDFCFCDDYVKKYQKPIPVWMDFDFTHGGFEGNFHHFLSDKIKAEDEARAKAATSAAA